MQVLNGGNRNTIAGAKVGDTILVVLNSNKVEKIILNEIKRNGVEGFDVNLIGKPLTFYPFHNILKIKRYVNS